MAEPLPEALLAQKRDVAVDPQPEPAKQARPGRQVAVAAGGGVAAVAVVLAAYNLRLATSSVPPIIPDLPIGQTGRSLLVTIPVLCFGLAAWAAPAIRSRFGEERALFVLLVALTVGMVARAVRPDSALFLGTILACVAIAVMNVLMPTVVRRRFPKRLGPMTAAYTVALSVGAGMASGLTIPVRTATDGSLGWALGIWAIPAAIALLFWIPQLRAGRPAPRPGPAFFGLMRDPLAWQVTLFFGLQSFVYYSCLSWLPAIYRSRGVDPSTAGILLGVMNFIGIFGNVAGPMLASRFRDQRPVVAIASGVSLVALGGFLLAPASTAMIWVIAFGIGGSATFSVAMLFLGLRAGDSATAARLSSMTLGIGYLISSTGPLTAGLLHAATGGWSVPLLAVIAACVGQSLFGLGAGRVRTVGMGAPGPVL